MTSFYHLSGSSTWEVISRSTPLRDFDLLESLADRGVFWANIGWGEQDRQLPLGHRAYLVMVEGPEMSWIERQTRHIDAPIMVLGMMNSYGYQHQGITYLPWIEWHYQTRAMLKAFPWQPKTRCDYLASALSARVSQSKIWGIMALMDHINPDQLLISVGANIEPKDVHGWEPTNNPVLDDLTDLFRKQYAGSKISVDDFDLENQAATTNHDFRARPYSSVVFNINNESWHYSYTQTDNKQWIYPGPFLTEKTMKCLLSETAIISNGQFDTYRTLEALGLRFDYGLDLSYDADPGNLSRAQAMVEMIESLADHDLSYWFDRTSESRRHNRQHIVSGDFYDACQAINTRTLEQIQQMLS